MIDLPGQGSSPGREFTFDVNVVTPISLRTDWSEDKNSKLNHLAIYSVSRSDYFTAQAAEQDTRIQIWIASTSIYGITEIFKKELGSSLKTPSQLMSTISKLAGNLSRSVDLNFQKYVRQFGIIDSKKIVDEALERVEVVNYQKVQCPCLFIMGEREGIEL